MLAGLPRAPNYYAPLSNLNRAKSRLRIVLELMVRGGYITRDQADTAFRDFKVRPGPFILRDRENNRAP